MTLPATIRTGATAVMASIGPWEVGSNLYVAAWDGINNTVMMMKSTDSGSTWSEVDAAGHPNATYGCSGVLYSGTIYVAYEDSGTATIYILTFDTSNDTWGASPLGGPIFTSGGSEEFYELVVRGAGSYVVLYCGTRSYMGNGYTTVMLRRYVSGAWQTAQRVDGQTTYLAEYPRGLAGPDASGRCYIFMSIGGGAIRNKVLKADNTLSAQSADGTYSGTKRGSSLINGSEVVFFADNGNFGAIVHRGTAGDTLSITETVVSDLAGSVNSAYMTGIANRSGKLYAVFPHNFDGDLYRSRDDGNNTWVADTKMETCAAYYGAVCQLVATGIGVVWEDVSGTYDLKYDYWSFPSLPPPTPPKRIWRRRMTV